ncbi:MAG TPA: hypothetical protein VK483_05230 [Chitinophagaceae bacterium]|nr:hypothetical protein [Chitinophagaceae bacterium]
MATTTQINYLSIALTIGGHHLILETEKIPTKADVAVATDKIANQLKDMMLNLSFKMEKGKVITVSVTDFINSVKDKVGAAGVTALNGFFTEVAGATEGINIELWDLFFTTSNSKKDPKDETSKAQGTLSFGFKVRVILTKVFYDKLSIPGEVTNVIAINSLGLGAVVEKQFDLS